MLDLVRSIINPFPLVRWCVIERASWSETDGAKRKERERARERESEREREGERERERERERKRESTVYSFSWVTIIVTSVGYIAEQSNSY